METKLGRSKSVGIEMDESPEEVANMVREWAIGDMRYPGQWDAEQVFFLSV